MSNLDMSHYYNGVAAHNSSHQVAETMALHQTIKSQVEVTEELHKTIKAQIEVTNKQQRWLWVLTGVGLFLALVQAVGTIAPLWPISKKPGQTDNSPAPLQHGKEQANPLPSEVHASPPAIGPASNPAVQGTLRDKAAQRR